MTLFIALWPLLVSVAVYVTLFPTVTGSGESLSVTERSGAADGCVSAVEVEALLFPGFGSLGASETAAVNGLAAPAPGRTTIVTVAPLEFSGEISHVTVPPASLHAPRVLVEETYVTPGGNVWVREASLTAAGPALDIAIV